MNELTPFVTPESLLCNGSTNFQTFQMATLQVTVQNSTDATVDLSNCGLRIEFPVDDGGDSSSSALLMSQYSGGEAPPDGTALQPLVTVEAAPDLGTNWTIDPADDGSPCAFLATPSPGSGPLEAGDSLSFAFSNIVVDLVPGTCQIDVTVVAGDGISTTGSPAIVKAPAPADILSFSATPSVLQPPSNQTTLTWATSGASSSQLAWNQATTTVSYNGQTQTNPWDSAPLDAAASSPVTATLDTDDEFTLTAAGSTVAVQQQTVTLTQPTLSAPLSVSPNVPFELTWNCFTGSSPVITWPPPPATQPLSLTDTNGNTLISGTVSNQSNPLPNAGTALVEIVVPISFELELAGQSGGSVAAVTVSVDKASITDGAMAAIESDPTSGYQYATLTWEAANATSFSLQGPDGTSPIPLLPGIVSNGQCTLQWDLENYPQYQPVTYTITAQDYVTPPAPFPFVTIPVTPLPVTLSDLASTAVSVDPDNGSQWVTLTWQATNATEFEINDDDGNGNVTTIPSGTYGAVASGLSSVVMSLPSYNPQYIITAGGYLPVSAYLGVMRQPVVIYGQLLASVSPPSKRGQTLTLSWLATNATGFTVSGPNVSQQLSATVRSTTFPLGGGGTYTLTAHGLPEPTASVTVGSQVFPKEKEYKEKERKEKDGKELSLAEKITQEVLPRAMSYSPDAPSGRARAFIGAEDRMDPQTAPPPKSGGTGRQTPGGAK